MTSDDTSISSGTTGNDITTTSTSTALYKHNININIKQRVCIYVSSQHWALFKNQAAQLGYSASELLDHFITSVVNNNIATNTKAPPVFNIAIAKSESKPVINIGEYLAKKELDSLLQKVQKLKERADREHQERDMPMTWTVEQSKVLEESIKKALKGLHHLDPEKLQEVEAALTVLKSIRGERP